MNIEHVLIADDDADDIEVLTDAIKHYSTSIKITIAPDGNCLLNTLNDDADLPQLIILDYRMPCYNGMECLSLIRSNRRYKDIIIIVYSTSDVPQDVKKCLELGANHYVVKQTNFADVLQFAETFSTGALKMHSKVHP